MTKSTCGWSIYLPHSKLEEDSSKPGSRKTISGKEYKASLDTTFSKLRGPDLEASKKSKDYFKAQIARESVATLAISRNPIKKKVFNLHSKLLCIS